MVHDGKMKFRNKANETKQSSNLWEEIWVHNPDRKGYERGKIVKVMDYSLISGDMRRKDMQKAR